MGAAYEMSDDDRREIVAEFLSESDQHIQTLNSLLLKAEELIKSGQTVGADHINTMFRSAHTIKGSSSMLGFDNLSHLTHEMETLLDKVRNGKMPLTMPVIEVLFTAFDALNNLLEKLRNEGNDKEDVSTVITAIKAFLTGDGTAPAASSGTAHAHVAPAAAAPAAPAAPQPAAPVSASPGIDPDTVKYLPAFLEDGDNCVNRFNDILMAFEKNDFSTDRLNELFRLAHTLKGSSGIIKCRGIEKVAHRMEDILSDLRNKNEKPSVPVTALLFKGIDWIKAALDQLRKGVYAEADITAFLNEFSAVNPAAASTATDAASDPFATSNLSTENKSRIRGALLINNSIYRVKIKIQPKAVKPLKASLVEEKMKKGGIVILAHPAFESVTDVQAELPIDVLYATAANENDIKTIVAVDEVDCLSITKEDFDVLKMRAPKPQPVSPPPAAPVAVAAPVPAAPTAAPAAAAPAGAQAAAKAAPVEITTMRVDSRKLDNLMNLAGELVITRARFAQMVSEFNNEVFQIKELGSRIGQLNAQVESVKGLIRKAAVDKTVDTDKIVKTVENLEANISHLQTNMSYKTIAARVYGLDEATSILGKLSSDIQSAVMQTRMVQIETVFSRFRRLVRDVSKEVGKEVNLELFGEETELDKKIIDSLPDSLTHMIRNSIDHGIEQKKDRLAAGKKEAGTVFLKALHQGNSICIEVGDDGKGLDPAKIAKKALEKGLITEEKLAKMEDKDKLNFVFLPGFSTAEKVTGLSGRGVGMDVVKKMIEALSGTIDIRSEVGKGTTFSLKIPLTLAIIQALLVVIGEQVFAIPLEQVSEIIKIGSNDVYSVDGNPMIKLRGHALSLMDMSNILGVEEQKDVDAEKKVVVVTSNGDLAGIAVDRLIGEDEIVIKAFPDYFANVRGISGASILGDGNIALILDVSSIIREV